MDLSEARSPICEVTYSFHSHAIGVSIGGNEFRGAQRKNRAGKATPHIARRDTMLCLIYRLAGSCHDSAVSMG
jgi:hypothetical protein